MRIEVSLIFGEIMGIECASRRRRRTTTTTITRSGLRHRQKCLHKCKKNKICKKTFQKAKRILKLENIALYCISLDFCKKNKFVTFLKKIKALKAAIMSAINEKSEK